MCSAVARRDNQPTRCVRRFEKIEEAHADQSLQCVAPMRLDNAHRKLDAAGLFAAYGWPADLTDEEILERLLALNLARADALSRQSN